MLKANVDRKNEIFDLELSGKPADIISDYTVLAADVAKVLVRSGVPPLMATGAIKLGIGIALEHIDNVEE